MDTKLILMIIAAAFIVTIALVVFVVVRNNKSYVVIEDEQEEKPKKAKSKAKKKIKNKKNIFEFEDDLNIEETNSNGLINYDNYNMSAKEKQKWALMAMAIAFIASYIFYKSIICSSIFCLIGLKYPEIKKKEIIYNRKQKLLLQFKEALYVISTSLSAGKSVENAFIDAHEDLQSVFSFEKENYILDELLYINRRIKMNQTIEDALEDFANRSGLEDVRTFTNVFIACKTTGGNLKSVTEITSRIIGEKINIKQDIQTMVSGKKFEANMLGVIPFGLILFLDASAPDFLNALYTLPGRLMSTVALIVIAISVLWGRKIMSIEV